ncbi:MAG: hypothetical protein A2932_01445 [Candidatus Spechtbacteria bacterium RIFCSPLOWO2_01_FULL_46_10]|uniref:DNA recombination protein RmuC n=1 Tax=Candidatus Spechtbacteria bacterium RIFCSPLOWO2_01_FULL_46_10 TaxID=1802163 RepID=A0A1G2HH52_9BACT|nr:MAG: hypothetical protein A2932_01445 [Candidatus Spechtbacteria bacterium RIFCSPLOWO2_01_FULL_46_10]
MIISVILGVFVVILFTAAAYLLWRQQKKVKQDPAFLMMQNQLEAMRKVLDERLGESMQSFQRQSSESSRVMQDIVEKLTEVRETNKQVFNVTEQLQNLEKVLKNQKQRGNLGEAGLELILSNILPPDAYKMQYGFPNGEVVDAAIFTKDGIISVDAKFSLDNYTRILDETDEERRRALEKEFKNDLKRRIDETAKYIRPKDGTLPFAFMFIPAEGIYYDLLVNEIGAVKVNTRSLVDYAYRDKNVIIVSPTTFAAYLQSVLYGFRAFKIEESAKEIAERVEDLGRHIKSHEDYMKKLGGSLGTTVGHYNSAYKELKKVDKDVARVTRGSSDMEPLALERPTLDEDID